MKRPPLGIILSGIYGIILGFLFIETILRGLASIIKSWFGIEVHASLLDLAGALKGIALSSGILFVLFLGLLLIVGAVGYLFRDVAFRAAFYTTYLFGEISPIKAVIFAIFVIILLIVAYTFAWILGVMIFGIALVLGNLVFIFGMGGKKVRDIVQFMHGAVVVFFGFSTSIMFLLVTVSPYRGDPSTWPCFWLSLALTIPSAIIYSYLGQDHVKEYFGG